MASKFDQRAVFDTPSKNVFNLSYRTRLSAIMGQLIPVLNKEVLPGDRWRLGMQTLIRLAPLKAPIFDGVKADFHAFFVPNRILDPKWKQFITGGNSLSVSSGSDEEIDPLTFNTINYIEWNSPQGENRGFHLSGLFDYLNLHAARYNTDGSVVVGSGDSTPYQKISALPVLGYHKIWSDWYRNERIEPGIALGGDDFTGIQFTLSDERQVLGLVADGTSWVSLADKSNLFDQLHLRNYKKDRFTTALPEPVIGGPVTIPGTGVSGVETSEVLGFDGKGVAYGQIGYVQGTKYIPVVNAVNDNPDSVVGSPITLSTGMSNLQSGSGHLTLNITPSSTNVVTSIANAAQATIQELKTAFRMYSFYMKDTYNGNRYVEFMESHHNVRVPDATIDRAIYLGGTTVPIQFGEVFQTSGSTESGSNALGDYAGRGVGAKSDFLFDESFLEHGQLYVIMSIVPNNTYFQGIDPKFLKNDRFDYFFPEFQNIGDVAIKNKELYYDTRSAGEGSVDQNDDVFGYQSRWYDLKSFTDEIHGDFIPNTNGPTSNMAFWNFARYYEDLPKLSPTFSNIQPQNAPFAVLDEWSDNYYIDIQWNIKALRPIYYYESF